MVLLTGAGLSARAGLGTFRGPDGLWALAPEAEEAMHAERLPGSLPMLWRIWGEMASRARAHGPTPGHLAAARLGARIITQNIDGLHQLAGSREVAELHGSALRAVCLTDSCPWSAAVTPGHGDHARDHGAPDSCPLCGAPTRPDVVLFDELLPTDALAAAERWTADCDLFVAVGTSGTVHPAARLVHRAAAHGATTVLIDVAPSAAALAAGYDRVIVRDAHEVLPEWEARAAGRPRNPFLEPFGREG
ncbi:NAD-dependent protein deacetylase [Brachybacterium sp. EF45031]|nr:NAD-dependent protein deacetylase [Brachybacterium sillae]